MKRLLICLLLGLALLAWSQTGRFGTPNPVAQANAAYRDGDYAAAAKDFERAARAHPDEPELTANQAAALYRLQRFAEADERYQAAEARTDDARAARAEYDRGNCAVKQACKTGEPPDPKLLAEAAEHYRACLNHESTAGDDPLFRDARHNLELTKLLLGRDSPSNPSRQANVGDSHEFDDLCPECRRKALAERAGWRNYPQTAKNNPGEAPKESDRGKNGAQDEKAGDREQMAKTGEEEKESGDTDDPFNQEPKEGAQKKADQKTAKTKAQQPSESNPSKPST